MEYFTVEQTKKMKEICKGIFDYIHKEIIPYLREHITIRIQSERNIKDLVIMIFPKSDKPIKLFKGNGYDIYNTPERGDYDFFNDPNLSFTKEMWQIISNWNEGMEIKHYLLKKIEQSKKFAETIDNFTV